jgi:DNA-binding protein Fis/ribosomal protein S18 acetylase RimI-like enzyme
MGIMPELSFQFRTPTPAETAFTAGELLEHSRAETGLSVEHQPFGLFAYSGDKMIGSIIGKVFFNWLHLDLIWVDGKYRRGGIGKNLMIRALEKAKEMGLSGIEVWTQSWQAPEFYRKLGYEEFAVIDDFTPGRKRYAFRYSIGKPQIAAASGSAMSLPDIVREQVRSYFRLHGDGLPSSGIYDRLMPLFEKPLIEVTLEATGGNQLKAAKLLGINRNTLHKKIRDLGIGIAKSGRKTPD